jgi:ribosomal protein S18 acetylase RimI-like enzyme
MSSTYDGHDAAHQQPGDDGYARIVRVGAERLDEVEPLWLSLAAQDTAVGAATGPRLDSRESWRRARQRHAAQLEHPGSFLLLAEHDSWVIGYAAVSIEQRPSLTWDADSRRAWVAYMSVLAEHRNHGVGSSLISTVKSELRALGLDRVTLGVAAANKKAQRFYRAHGFDVESLEMATWL